MKDCLPCLSPYSLARTGLRLIVRSGMGSDSATLLRII